jgi:mannose-6-phosphate isomerase
MHASTAHRLALYPLLLQPLFYEKVWGGRALERLGKHLPPGQSIGESWELADMPVTSASGAGGASARTTIVNGPFAGTTLADLIRHGRAALLGQSPLSDEGGFPLLVKFLDAHENLSVQVHPSPSYALAHKDCKLKTECWYILDARPDAVIYKGIKPGITPDQFAKAIHDATVHHLLIAVPAIPGECHNLPSGTCHALGAGVLVAEVQTPSDTTFRVYDWGRTGRALHIEQALACIDFEPAPAATSFATARAPGSHTARLVTTPFFTLDQLLLDPGQPHALTVPGHATALIAIEADLTITSTSASFEPVKLHRGATALLPAAIAGAAILTAGPRPASVLVARVTGEC